MIGALFYVKGEKSRGIKGADGREDKGEEKGKKREGEKEGASMVERRKEKMCIQLCPLRRPQERSATGARGLFLHH